LFAQLVSKIFNTCGHDPPTSKTDRRTDRQTALCTVVHCAVKHTHTIVLLLFWNLSGTTRVSRYQKGKTRKGKTNLDLLEQEIVSGRGICWAMCNAYSLRPPVSLPLRGDTWVHLIPHSTHPQSSSLYGAVKARSLSEIEKRVQPDRLVTQSIATPLLSQGEPTV